MNPRNGSADLLLLLEEEGRRWEAKFATVGVKWRSAPRHRRSGLFNGSPPPHQLYGFWENVLLCARTLVQSLHHTHTFSRNQCVPVRFLRGIH
jgi:hypothetical protein